MAFRLRTPLGRRLRSRPEDGLSLAEVLIAVFIITPVLIFFTEDLFAKRAGSDRKLG
jgi:hypothetical protein